MTAKGPAAGAVAVTVRAELAAVRSTAKVQLAAVAATEHVPPLAAADIFWAVAGNCTRTVTSVASKGPLLEHVGFGKG